MKKILIITITIIALTVVLSSVLCFADPIKPTMKGPDILRANDTLRVTCSVENIACYGFQGNITYNSEIMTLVSAKALPDNWVIELIGEGKFLAYSKTPMDPKTEFKGGDIFSFEFLISDSADAGEVATLSFTNVIATDSEEEIVIPDYEYRKPIDPPASSDATISALYITNANYSPAFSPDVTEYTVPMGVGYDVTSLNITAIASDDKATYTIEGNELRVGNNTVTIKVMAEDGTTKEYTIKLRRAHSPTDKLSDNTRLSELIISSGVLSPAFSPDVREYIVYLPYEAESFLAYGTAEDEFAKEVINGEGVLEPGVNPITVGCRAEDGSLGEYIINVVVMPEYTGIIPDIKNAIPLVGDIDIIGEYKVGGTLAVLLTDGYQGSEFVVNWYRDGQLVASGEQYFVTDEDKQSMLSVEVEGKGLFYGKIYGPRLAVLKSGEIVSGDRYISESQTDMTVLTMAAVFVVSVALSGGIIFGRRRQTKNNK